MTNKSTPAIPAELSNAWEKAETLVADEFDHGDGQRETRKAAIVANLLSLSKGVTLDAMWNKIDAHKRDKLLEQVAGLEAHVDDADDAVESVWDRMTPEQKENYLAWHPRSRFHAVKRRENTFNARDNPNDKKDPKHKDGRKKVKPKKGTQVEDTPVEDADDESTGEKPKKGKRKKAKNGSSDWWSRLSIEQQAEYLRKHPNSKKAKRHKGIIRNLVGAALHKVHGHVRKLGHDYRNGMEGLRNFRAGKAVTPKQREGLSATAKVVGGLVVGALVGVALFTPLGGYAAELGTMYLDHLLEGKSESGVNLNDHSSKSNLKAEEQDKEDLDHMTMDMTNWLLTQDPIELAKELKRRSEK